MSNVYYEPQDFGLEIVQSLDEADLSYEFNTFLVLKHINSGRLYYCQDAGCSCPTPFEDFEFKSVNDTNMSEITLESFERFRSDLEAFPVSDSEKSELIVKVKSLLSV